MLSQLILSLGLAAATLAAQPAPIAFEVAAIHPVEPESVIGEYSVTGSRVRFEVFSLPMLVQHAYPVEDYQVIFDPQKTQNLRGFYTIDARAPGTGAPTPAQINEMLKELLTSRFHLKFHTEPREVPVYSLGVARSGPRLNATKPGAPVQLFNKSCFQRDCTIDATHMSMQSLATELRVFVDRPVIDKTGLPGEYDVKLTATIFRHLNDDPQPDDVVISTAIRELGLTLQQGRLPVPVMVVDVVESPTEN